ncbi:hypothetical protein SAMN04490357_0433 [Streptomyces misionensis]|uniref:Uncharacterized protein n=1 Tax=Streptomyces misionensis TaxID=67331 RepID=A0A1H4MBE6_9ACTN|nr:hypothetical protein SAMN04490357_0433 [Streptomyces misionensis]
MGAVRREGRRPASRPDGQDRQLGVGGGDGRQDGGVGDPEVRHAVDRSLPVDHRPRVVRRARGAGPDGVPVGAHPSAQVRVGQGVGRCRVRRSRKRPQRRRQVRHLPEPRAQHRHVAAFGVRQEPGIDDGGFERIGRAQPDLSTGDRLHQEGGGPGLVPPRRQLAEQRRAGRGQQVQVPRPVRAVLAGGPDQHPADVQLPARFLGRQARVQLGRGGQRHEDTRLVGQVGADARQVRLAPDVDLLQVRGRTDAAAQEHGGGAVGAAGQYVGAGHQGGPLALHDDLRAADPAPAHHQPVHQGVVEDRQVGPCPGRRVQVGEGGVETQPVPPC